MTTEHGLLERAKSCHHSMNAEFRHYATCLVDGEDKTRRNPNAELCAACDKWEPRKEMEVVELGLGIVQ